MSTTTGWHAPPELLRAYVEGRLDAVLGASLERHVDACQECRTALRPVADAPLLDEVWLGLRARAERPHLPRLIRLARRLGLQEPTAILLAATASLRVAWVSSAFVALGFAVIASMSAGENTLWPFLLMAPLVPVLGVAAAYGPSDEPFEVLAVASPYGRTRLILVRTLAVLLTSVPGACLLGLALPGPSWVAVAWLGPALALLPLLLAIASFVGPRLAVGLVSALWCAAVIAPVRSFPATWPVEADRQLVYLGLGLAASLVLFVRSRQTRQMGVVL